MSNDKELVVYVGPYGFPNGGAAARRIYGNCLSLKAAGYDVIVASGQLSAGIPDEYNGIKVLSYDERRYENLPRLLKHVLYFSAGKKAVKWLEELDKKPTAIVIYSGYSPYLLRVLGWARKNHVKVIFDAVEWYDSPSLLSSILSPYYINIEFAMRFLIKKCDGVIAISKYLKDYYEGSVGNVIKVPPTVDCNGIVPRLFIESCDSVSVVYAGTPGTKDSLSTIVEAVLAIAATGRKIKFNIAGINSSQLINYLPKKDYKISNLNEVITCYGILDHPSTLDLVRKSDYSIIIRPDIRSVQAGFPTKFVESMAVGTPVIANITSDLGRYLEDHSNGFICSDSSLETLIDTLSYCFEVTNQIEMRTRSRSTAERYFDYSVYSDSFKQLLN